VTGAKGEQQSVKTIEDPLGSKPPWRRIAALGLIAAALLAAVYLSPLRGWLGRVRDISGYIRELGAIGPLVFTIGVAMLVAIGFPRLLFCVIAGMALGFWRGLLWAQLGSLIGNYAVFAVARRSTGGWVEKYVSARPRLLELIRREGVAGVILARQVPVPGLVINLACALLPLRQRDYLLGTALGQLVEAIPLTMIGAGALQESFVRSAVIIGLAVALGLTLWIGLKWFLSKA